MTVRTRVAVALACACLLSWSVVASGRKVSAATASVQIALADVLYDRADYRAAMHVYMAATDCEDAAIRDRARAGTVRSALRIAEFGVAITQMAGPRRGAHDRSGHAGAGRRRAVGVGPLRRGGGRLHRRAAARPVEPAGAGWGWPRRSPPGTRWGRRSTRSRRRFAARPAMPTSARRSERSTSGCTATTRPPRRTCAYLSALRGADRPEQTQWARSHISFLRSFDGSVPFEMESARNVKVHVFDFRLVSGKVVLKGKINGGRSVDLTLDTGAEHTAISERTAARFGVQPLTETLTAGVGEAGLRGQRLARIRSLQIGTLTIYNLPCLIKTPSMAGLPVDSTDGFSPLALGLSMTVDYRARRVYLGALEADASPARELPLRFTRLATVEGRVNDTPMSFIVDTGGEGILVSTSAARGLFTPTDRRRIKLRVYGASGYEPDAYLLPGIDLSFGPLRLPNQPVVVLDLRAPSVLLGYDVGGVLGYRLLGRYRVDFDLVRSVLRLRDL